MYYNLYLYFYFLKLRTTALDHTEELFKMTNEIDIIERLRGISLSGDLDRLNDFGKSFLEHCDHIQEVCRLLHNIANSESLQIISRNTELLVSVFGSQILIACKTLSTHPNSKIAKDNLDVFLDFWISLWSDIHQLAKSLRDEVIALDSYNNYYSPNTLSRHGRSPKSDSMQLSSPPLLHSHHSTAVSSPSSSSHHQQQAESLSTMYGQEASSGSLNDPSIYKPAKPLDREEQLRIAKTGLEMKMASSQLDAEAEKLPNSEDNQIVRHAKNMSQMAFSMYQFTKGEGDLKTTQDLFTQAEFFAEEANKFYKLVRHFSYQVCRKAFKIQNINDAHVNINNNHLFKTNINSSSLLN